MLTDIEVGQELSQVSQEEETDQHSYHGQHKITPAHGVCMDYLTLETSAGGYRHMLVITDHFSRYAQAFPTKNQTRTTADVLLKNFIVHYRFPRRLHSDQGADFLGNVI